MPDFFQDVNEIHRYYTRKYEDRTTAVLKKYSERYPEVLDTINRYLQNNNAGIPIVRTLCKQTLTGTGIRLDLGGLDADGQLVLLFENKRIGSMRAEQQDKYTCYRCQSGASALFIVVPEKERRRLTRTLCKRDGVPYAKPMEHDDNFTISASYRKGDTTVIIVAWENFLAAVETMLDSDNNEIPNTRWRDHSTFIDYLDWQLNLNLC